MCQGVFQSTVSDARDANIRLDRHDHVTLIKGLVQTWRLVDADAGDFCLRERSLGGPLAHDSSARCDCQ
ncbi:hypothetical protein ACFL1R_00315 [Candidatus Latescibacterota bacterium]